MAASSIAPTPVGQKKKKKKVPTLVLVGGPFCTLFSRSLTHAELGTRKLIVATHYSPVLMLVSTPSIHSRISGGNDGLLTRPILVTHQSGSVAVRRARTAACLRATFTPSLGDPLAANRRLGIRSRAVFMRWAFCFFVPVWLTTTERVHP